MTYATLQTPQARHVRLFSGVRVGISSREDEAAAEAVPEAIGWPSPVCRGA